MFYLKSIQLRVVAFLVGALSTGVCSIPPSNLEAAFLNCSAAEAVATAGAAAGRLPGVPRDWPQVSRQQRDSQLAAQ